MATEQGKSRNSFHRLAGKEELLKRGGANRLQHSSDGLHTLSLRYVGDYLEMTSFMCSVGDWVECGKACEESIERQNKDYWGREENEDSEEDGESEESEESEGSDEF